MDVMCKTALFILLALVTHSSFGQFSDTVNYHLKAAATGNMNRTNTGTSSIFNNLLGFDINKKHVSFNSSAAYIYGRNPTQKTNDDFIAVMNFDYLQAVSKLYYWGLASYEKSFSLKVDNRFQAGGGLGYNIMNKPEATIIVSDGLLFETADLSQKDQYGRTSYQTLRNSFRLKFRFRIKDDLITVDGTEFLQNSLSEGQDFILKLNANFSIRLYKWLSLTSAFNYNRMNAIGTENLFLSYGLTFDRYF
jgi:hypothetical protein